jgi:APA family basic amino acid/polyamine antiporter
MTEASHAAPAAPRRVLSTLDGVVLVVGIIVGAGIFRTPPLVASNLPGTATFLLVCCSAGSAR